ncbi:MAG: PDZ domain-containing protein [Mycobacteriaceae bacterium]|nr:PDZ domain-containing protein [Mycobacteriaceae bacterium]
MKKMMTVLIALALGVSASNGFADPIQITQTPPVTPPAIENKGVEPDLDELLNKALEDLNKAQPGAKPGGQPGFNLFGLPGGHPEMKLRPEDYQLEFMLQWQNVMQSYWEAEKLGTVIELGKKYNGKVRNQEQLDTALAELATAVNDRWTSYQSGKQMLDVMAAIKEGKRDPGLYLIRDAKGNFKVDFIKFQSPAYNSRLRRGDSVTKLNGESIKGLTDAQVDSKMLTKVGESVKVTYVEDGKEKEETIVMSVTKKDQLDVRLVNGNVGYIRIPSLSDEDISMEVLVGLMMLEEDHGAKSVKGLVLDLRSNPGGIVQSTITLASVFAGSGPVSHVSTRKGLTVQKTTYEVRELPSFATKDMPAEAKEFVNLLKKKPMVILVDECTMSAAELLTGALKDNGRAVVVGNTTFGKGQVLFEEEVLGGGSFTITSGRYFTPKGTDVTDTGISPHVQATRPRGSDKDGQLETALAELQKLIDGTTTVAQFDDGKPAIANGVPTPAVLKADSSSSTNWALVTTVGVFAFLAGGAVIFFFTRRQSAK